jgi:hypothetical protein
LRGIYEEVSKIITSRRAEDQQALREVNLTEVEAAQSFRVASLRLVLDCSINRIIPKQELPFGIRLYPSGKVLLTKKLESLLEVRPRGRFWSELVNSWGVLIAVKECCPFKTSAIEISNDTNNADLEHLEKYPCRRPTLQSRKRIPTSILSDILNLY